MQFKTPLVRGILLKRYKRFLADVRLDTGEEITAHCANPGSMLGLNVPGSTIWLQKSADPKRKLAYSWELLEQDGAMIGINTAHPNGIVAEAILTGALPALSGYSTLRREVRYGEHSRVDILLADAARPDAYVEVKNAHLSRRPGLAEFPDSVTARGAKHLAELSKMVAEGHRAVMVFLVQRDDCTAFALAKDLDPAYALGFERARAAGVEALAIDCAITTEGIIPRCALPIRD